MCSSLIPSTLHFMSSPRFPLSSLLSLLPCSFAMTFVGPGISLSCSFFFFLHVVNIWLQIVVERLTCFKTAVSKYFYITLPTNLPPDSARVSVHNSFFLFFLRSVVSCDDHNTDVGSFRLTSMCLRKKD